MKQRCPGSDKLFIFTATGSQPASEPAWPRLGLPAIRVSADLKVTRLLRGCTPREWEAKPAPPANSVMRQQAWLIRWAKTSLRNPAQFAVARKFAGSAAGEKVESGVSGPNRKFPFLSSTLHRRCFPGSRL